MDMSALNCRDPQLLFKHWKGFGWFINLVVFPERLGGIEKDQVRSGIQGNFQAKLLLIEFSANGTAPKYDCKRFTCRTIWTHQVYMC